MAGITSYNFKSGFKHELEVVSLASLYASHRQMVTHPHRANFYHIFWFANGPHTHHVDFKPITIKKNSLLFVNKEQVQSFDQLGNIDGKLILFTDRFFAKSPDDVRFLNNSILFNDFMEPAVLNLSKQTSALTIYFQHIEKEFAIDGATTVTDADKTATNKTLLKSFVDDILVTGRMEKLAGYFNGDNYIQHNPLIPDQLSGLGKALEAWAKQGITMKYDTIHTVLGEGNFVLVVSEGHLAGKHSSFYDLFRVENGKIAEHWDTIEEIPAKNNWQNGNGKFGF
jgi:predicted SnoaL-like aldol condensation-catalyzing enzyme